MDKRLLQVLNGTHDNYIAPFLWLHNEDDSLIVRELEKIYESGIRGVCLESRTHEEFCKEDWWSDCRLIMDFCKAHDMKVWILDDKHFPSGYSNGYIKEHPEYAESNITEKHIDIAGPVTDGSLILDFWKEAPDEEIISVLACEHIPDSKVLTGKVIDLTGCLEGDRIYFDLPEGMWRIVFLKRIQQTLGPSALNYCDKLNPEAVRVFIREVYDKHYENLSEYFGNTFVGFFSDEPGFRNNGNNPHTFIGEIYNAFPWHSCVREHFEKLYGENAMRNLLPLWFEFRDLPYNEYRTEYMDFITYTYGKNFTSQLADWCHEHGVEYIGHVIEDNNCHARTSYSAGHYFRALSAQDMAGIDVVLHQIIPGLTECSNSGPVSYKEMENRFFNYYLAKLGSSLAHYKPHMKGRAMCEIFGAFGWAEGTKFMKYLMDHMLVRGINYYVPHAFSPKDDPRDCPPTFYLGGRNPIYPYFKYIMGHMNRMCHLLSNARHVNTCALLYNAESQWIRTDYLPLEDVAKVLYDNLLDYDIIPSEELENITSEGRLGDAQYKILLVPYAEYVPERVRKALENTKIRIVVVSDKKDEKYETVKPSELCEFMHKNGYADISSDNTNFNLRYCHYIREDAHIYMFFNEDINHAVSTTVKLSGFGGGRYVVYDAFENKACTKLSADGSVEVCLEPYNSVVIMTGDVELDGICCAKEKSIMWEKPLEAEYDIALKDIDEDDFKPYMTTKRLFSINGKEGVDRFAGNIRYTAKLNIDEKGGYIIDLGNVGEIASLKVNGKDAGVKLFPPYSFDISDYVTEGENELEITVTNNAAYKFRDYLSRFMLLEPTGLLGPVKIKKY